MSTTLNSNKTTHKHPQNKVVDANFRTSQNFFESDVMLRHFLKKTTSPDAYRYMEGKWEVLGTLAATKMDKLSLLADKESPKLNKRNFLGETVNEVNFHPSYWELMNIAVKSEMLRVKWQPNLVDLFGKEKHRLGFATTFLYTMAEGGIPCPLCMTDGVARLINRYCTKEDKRRLLPRIYTTNPKEFYTGAMFLTEKAGGSDVGANLVSATHHQGDYYLLNGEKWFCSNVNADIIFALARTNPAVKGTKGLSIFMIEKTKPDGTKNEMDIVRLKDKLGVRSMASAECILTDTYGKLIGQEGQGFYIMADMINLSRLYNSVAALALMRRGLVEVYQYLNFRTSFGTNALNHALIREKLTELGALYTANFYLSFKAIQLLDIADGQSTDNKQAAELLRLITPMLKKDAAETGVYIIRECMELMGGIGYIEDGIMPKLMRDVMVLPIWEGAGNIMVLDMLRASIKSKGLNLLLNNIQTQFAKVAGSEELQTSLAEIRTLAQQLLSTNNQETMELTAKPMFKRLTQLYQIAVLLEFRDNTSKAWIDPAIGFLINSIHPPKLGLQKTLHKEEVAQLIAWKF